MKKVLLLVGFVCLLFQNQVFANSNTRDGKDIERNLNVMRCVGAINILASDTLICETQTGYITLKAKMSNADSLIVASSGATMFWTINGTDTIAGSIKLDNKYNISLTRANGAHADSAVALALAYQCLKSVRLPTKPFLPDWVKARKADRIINTANALNIRRY